MCWDADCTEEIAKHANAPVALEATPVFGGLVLADRLPEYIEGDNRPRAGAIAERGVTTGQEFATLMSAIMADVIAGRMPPDIASAAVRAGDKLLKVVEMQYRYARPRR